MSDESSLAEVIVRKAAEAGVPADVTERVVAYVHSAEQLRALADRLQAANAQMREALEKANATLDADAKGYVAIDQCYYEGDVARISATMTKVRAALTQDGSEWLAERKADKARIAELEKAMREVVKAFGKEGDRWQVGSEVYNLVVATLGPEEPQREAVDSEKKMTIT